MKKPIKQNQLKMITKEYLKTPIKQIVTLYGARLATITLEFYQPVKEFKYQKELNINSNT